MQKNSAAAAKQAVEAALKGLWEQAIELNLQILDVHPEDLDAKARLGRAYLQNKEFTKAKRLFKEILEKDPINTIALKNYKLAKEKIGIKTTAELNPKAMIKEPGTSTEINIQITAKRIFADGFSPGEELRIKVNKKTASFHKNGTLVGKTTDTHIINSLLQAKAHKAIVTANFVKGYDKSIRLVLNSSLSVFKSQKQAVKPYLKKGSIDEPKLEIELAEE